MSLIRKQKQQGCGETLINLCCAARLLNLDESTIRQGKCGTDRLTLIDVSNPESKRRRVQLILEEIITLKAEWIAAATNPTNRNQARATASASSQNDEIRPKRLRLIR